MGEMADYYGMEDPTWPTCILHPYESAYTTAQGILVCPDCYRRYTDERRMSDGQFQRRPFLQELIKASSASEISS